LIGEGDSNAKDDKFISLLKTIELICAFLGKQVSYQFFAVLELSLSVEFGSSTFYFVTEEYLHEGQCESSRQNVKPSQNQNINMLNK